MTFQKGQKAWNKGKHWSEEVRKNISEGFKKTYRKENHPLFGKKHSLETIEKMKQIKLGKKASEKTKLKMSMSSKNSINSGRFNSEKTSGKNNWRYIDGLSRKRKTNHSKAIRVWCQANNLHRVPDGCLIHHINQNPLDNRPENLQLMDRRFHNQLHTTFIKQNRLLT